MLAPLAVSRERVASSQYTSIDCTPTLADRGVLASVGSVGDAYGNALAETFVDTFKTELIADASGAPDRSSSSRTTAEAN